MEPEDKLREERIAEEDHYSDLAEKYPERIIKELILNTYAKYMKGLSIKDELEELIKLVSKDK